MGEPKGTLLAVDDEPLNLVLLTAALAEEGFAVETAPDGREALEKLAHGKYDVVLLDLIMPEVDGYQVLAEMKRSPALRHVPVIVISSLDDMESVIRCIEIGATDYLPKPFDPVLLKARLNASLAEKRMHDLARAYTAEIEALAEQLKVRNTFIRETFGRYLSEEIVATLLSSPDGLELGGQKRHVTILMSDIRGFSSLAERLAPEQVVRLVNNYLGAMADVVLDHNGTIDEFLGDSVLCFFGAPISRPDDALRAVRCALSMQREMARVNDANEAEGLPRVEMGIAVHTGDVIVGNIGSVKRTKYGAVGREINLAARIESFTVGGQVLISDSTLREAGPGVEVGDAVSIRAKGFAEPIPVHDLKGLGGEASLHLERPEEPLVPCDPPVPVRVTLMDGKHAGEEERCGEIVEISARRATLAGDFAFAPWESLRIRAAERRAGRLPDEIYAKVLPEPPRLPGTVPIRFTMLATGRFDVPPAGGAPTTTAATTPRSTR